MKNSMFLFIMTLGLGFHAQAQQTWTIDSSKSQVIWIGGKKLVKDNHDGTIAVKEGEVETDAEGNLKSGKIVLDMNSIKNNDIKNAKYREKLVVHLKSEDFFNTEAFPTAVFEIKSVEKVVEAPVEGEEQVKSDAGTKFNLTGELTIRDKKNKIVVPVTVNKVGKILFAKGTMEFDRTLWDVRYGSGKFFQSLGDKVIKDEIDITFKLQANPKAKVAAKK